MPRIQPTGRYVLFSAQKDEKPFLEEWIAFHRVLGFTDIVIYSNDCTDGSDVLLDRLAEHKLIQHYRHDPIEVAPQYNAERLAREAGIFRNGDWVMWSDTDEYLNVHIGGKKVQTLVRKSGDADAIVLNWRSFGDGGQEKWPGLQISENFVTCSMRRQPFNQTVKTLFQYSDKIERLDLHRPIISDLGVEQKFKFVDGGIKHLANWLDLEMRRKRIARSFNRGRYLLGQVNHYTIRTWDMYKMKMKRGRGAEKSSINERHNLGFFHSKNQNKHVDRSILKYAPAMLKELEIIKKAAGDLSVHS